jgi:hypothetical protein
MKKPKTSRRSQSQYPALNKKLNLPSRKEFIETDYINGVFNEEGKQVMRPLTHDEKKFLNDFYEETVGANFLHDTELKRLSDAKRKIIEDSEVIKLKEECKLISDRKEKNRLQQIIKCLKKQNEEKYEKKLRSIERLMQERRDKVLLYSNKEEHKQFYKANNDRNVCLFNKLNTSQEIRYFDLEEYEQVAQKTLDAIDYEDYLIDQIEGNNQEDILDLDYSYLDNVQELPKRRK